MRHSKSCSRALHKVKKQKKLPLLLKVCSLLPTSRYSPVSLVVSCAAQSAKPQTMVDLQKISHHQWGKRVESYQWTIFRSMVSHHTHSIIPSHPTWLIITQISRKEPSSIKRGRQMYFHPTLIWASFCRFVCSCPWKLKTQGYSCILQKSPRHTSGSDKRVEPEQIHPDGISRASMTVRIMRY